MSMSDLINRQSKNMSISQFRKLVEATELLPLEVNFRAVKIFFALQVFVT